MILRGSFCAYYERAIGELLPSLLYPYLDFAEEQARTDDGVSIREITDNSSLRAMA